MHGNIINTSKHENLMMHLSGEAPDARACLSQSAPPKNEREAETSKACPERERRETDHWKQIKRKRKDMASEEDKSRKGGREVGAVLCL